MCPLQQLACLQQRHVRINAIKTGLVLGDELRRLQVIISLGFHRYTFLRGFAVKLPYENLEIPANVADIGLQMHSEM